MKPSRFHFLLRRTLLLMLGSLLFVCQMSAQDLSLSITVLPPYPAEADYYLNNADNLSIELKNNTGRTIELYAGASLSSDGGVQVASKSGVKPSMPISLSPFEFRIISGSMLDELGMEVSYPDDFDISGISEAERNKILEERVIPEDNYRLCIQLYEWDTDALILESCSQDFEIIYAQPPVILSPDNYTIFEDIAQPMFVQWSPVRPGTEDLGEVEYAIQIIEIEQKTLDFGQEYVQLILKSRTNIVYEIEGLTGLSEVIDFQDFESLRSVTKDEIVYTMQIVAKDVENESSILNEGGSNLIAFGIDNVDEVDPIIAEPTNPKLTAPLPGTHFYTYDQQSITIEWEYDAPADDHIHYSYWIMDYTDLYEQGQTMEEMLDGFEIISKEKYDRAVYGYDEWDVEKHEVLPGADWFLDEPWFEEGHYYILCFWVHNQEHTAIFADSAIDYFEFADFHYGRQEIDDPILSIEDTVTGYTPVLKWTEEAILGTDMQYAMWVADFTDEYEAGQSYEQMIASFRNPWDHDYVISDQNMVGTTKRYIPNGYLKSGHYYIVLFTALDRNGVIQFVSTEEASTSMHEAFYYLPSGNFRAPKLLNPKEGGHYLLYNEEPFRVSWEFEAPASAKMRYKVFMYDYTDAFASGQSFDQIKADFDVNGEDSFERLLYTTEVEAVDFIDIETGDAGWVYEARNAFEEGTHYVIWFAAYDANYANPISFSGGESRAEQLTHFSYGAAALDDPILRVADHIYGNTIEISWTDIAIAGAEVEYGIWIADFTEEKANGMSLAQMEQLMSQQAASLTYSQPQIKDQNDLFLMAAEEGFEAGNYYVVMHSTLDANGVLSFQSTNSSVSYQFADFYYGTTGLADPVIYYPLPEAQFMGDELQMAWGQSELAEIEGDFQYVLTIYDMDYEFDQGISRNEILARLNQARLDSNLYTYESDVVFNTTLASNQTLYKLIKGDENFFGSAGWLEKDHFYVFELQLIDRSQTNVFASTMRADSWTYADFIYSNQKGLADPIITSPKADAWVAEVGMPVNWDFEAPEDILLYYGIRIFDITGLSESEYPDVKSSADFIYDREWENAGDSVYIEANTNHFSAELPGWFERGHSYLLALTLTAPQGDTTFASTGLPYSQTVTRVFKTDWDRAGSVAIISPLSDGEIYKREQASLRFNWEVYLEDPSLEEELTYTYGIYALHEANGFREADIENIENLSFAQIQAMMTQPSEIRLQPAQPITEKTFLLDFDSLFADVPYLFWVKVMADSATLKQTGLEQTAAWRVIELDGYQENSRLAITSPTDHFFEALADDQQIRFQWEASLPDPDMLDSLHYGYAVYRLSEETGFTEQEILALPERLYPDFVSDFLSFEAPFEEEGPYRENFIDFPLDSLTRGETYLFVLHAMSTTQDPKSIVFDDSYAFRVFYYEKSGLIREPEFVEMDSVLYADPSGNVSISWQKAGVPTNESANYDLVYRLRVLDLTASVGDTPGRDLNYFKERYLTDHVAREETHELFRQDDIPQSTTAWILNDSEIDSARSFNPYDTELVAPGGWVEGRQYMLCLEVSDRNENLRFAKSGVDTSYAEPFFFTYSRQAIVDACASDCYYQEAISEAAATNPLNFKTLKVGKFSIEDVQYSSSSTSTLSGEGVITLSLLNDTKVEVEFSGVKVNNNGRIFEGEVKAKQGSSSDFSLAQLNQDLANQNQIDESSAEALHHYILNDNNVSALATGQKVSMPIGLDQRLNGYRFALGFTEMSFRPDQAVCNIIVVLDLPTLGEGQYIAMGASELCMSEAGFASEYVLNLMSDLQIQADGEEVFSLKGSNADAATVKKEATYLAVNCEGIESFAIRGSVDLPQSMLVLEDSVGGVDLSQKVKAHFDFSVDKATQSDSVYDQYLDSYGTGLHWIAKLDIDPFQIKGVKGWGFEIEDAYLDMSDLANPDSMRLPGGELATANNDHAEDWTGFYLKRGYLRTPAEFMNGKERKRAEIANLIIDPMISADIRLTNLIKTNEGNLEGWGFSMDTVYFRIEESSFTAAGMIGKISTPVMDTTQYLDYTSILTYEMGDGLEYDFLVKSKDTLNFPMWAMAGVQLDSSSYISVNISDEETKLASFMKGAVGINLANLQEKSDEEEPDFNLSLSGISFELGYDTEDGFQNPVFGFADGSNNTESNGTGYRGGDNPVYWASTDEFSAFLEEEESASQHKLSGFPFSLEEIGIQASGNSVSLSITPRFALVGDEEGFAASTIVLINSELNLTDRNLKKFVYTGVSIECISLEVDISNLLLEGELCFYKEEVNGAVNKGTRGSLNVFVPGVDVGVNLAAEFGTSITDSNADFGTEDYYPYWFVDGLFYVGSTGIVIPPGFVTLHGMGGGISFNMRKVDPNATVSADAMRATAAVDTAAVTGNMDLDDVQRSEVSRVPSFGSRSISFTLIMAIIKAELMNMDVGMEVAWQKGQGIQSVSLLGDGYFFTPINDRNDPQLHAKKALTWNLLGEGQHTVDANLDVFMNFGVIKGGYDDNQMIQGANAHWQNFGGRRDKGYWDIQLGTYDTPGKAIIDWGSDNLTVTAETYLMAGHNVPTELPPLPDKITDLLNNGLSEIEGNTFEADVELEEGSLDRPAADLEKLSNGLGIAKGSQAELSFKLNAGPLAADFNAVIGYDILINYDADRVCYAADNSTVTPGYKGWYGNGQVYAGLDGSVGVRVKVFGDEQLIELMDLGAAVVLEGGAPNPTWMDGRATVSYSTLAGKLKGSQRFAISFGEQCETKQNSDLVNIDFIAGVAPSGNAVDPYSDAAATFHLPMNEIFYVPTITDEGDTLTRKYRPYLHQFSVAKQGEAALTPSKEMWNAQNTLVQLRFDDPFEPKEGIKTAPQYNIQVGVRAEIWDEENYAWIPYNYDGQVWEESESVSFRTAQHPETFDEDDILYSSPLNRQRYYLQDEAALWTNRSANSSLNPNSGKSGTKSTTVIRHQGGIYFKRNMAGFFPETDREGSYEYFLRFRANGEEDIEVALSNLAGKSSVSMIKFEMPRLENETLYAIQVVQRNTDKQALAQKNTAAQMLTSYQASNQAEDTYGSYQLLSQAASAERLSETVGRGEKMLYVMYFQTSAYDNLADKLAGAVVSNGIANLVLVETDEQFDEYDLLGGKTGDGEAIPPRVHIYDPFESDYHQTIAIPEMQSPYLDYLDHMSNNPVVLGYATPYEAVPDLILPGQTGAADATHIDWSSTQLQYQLNPSVMSGYQSSLKNAEINAQFGALSQVFAGGVTLAGNGFDMSSLSSTNGTTSSSKLAFAYETHFAIDEDAETIEDWAQFLFSEYFQYQGASSRHYYHYFLSNYRDLLTWRYDLLTRQDMFTDFSNGFSATSSSSKSSKPSQSPFSGGGNAARTNATYTYPLRFVSERGFETQTSKAGSTVELEVEINN